MEKSKGSADDDDDNETMMRMIRPITMMAQDHGFIRSQYQVSHQCLQIFHPYTILTVGGHGGKEPERCQKTHIL